jgi:hypothetical protein
MEYWSIAKYQIPSTKSQGVRFSAGGGSGREKIKLKPEH